jgi:hypothetical protein
VPLLLNDSGSLALQAGALVSNDAADQDELEGCCCGECNCEDIGAAVIGADFDVVLAGFVDDQCDDCDDTFNDTFSFLDVPTGGCGTSIATDFIDTECCSYRVFLEISTPPTGIRVSAISDAASAFQTIFVFHLEDICSVLDDLIAGTPINIPLEDVFPRGDDLDCCDPTATPTCTLTRTAPP